MKRGKMAAILFVSGLALSAGCGKEEKSSPPPPTNTSAEGVERFKKSAQDSVATTTDYLNREKEQLQKSLSDKLADLDKQLSGLKAKSGPVSDRARSEWTNALAQIQQRKEVAAKKLEQLKNSSADKWQDFKTAAESAFADLDRAVKNAFARPKDDHKSDSQ
jgi:hypothetical protein